MVYNSLFHKTLTKIPGTTKEEIGLAIESLVYIIDTVVKDAVKDMATKADIKDMATKADIRDIELRMATKADIKDMATKADITDMATKADIRDVELRMATKADIKNMATKTDIKEIELKMSQMETRLVRKMFGMAITTILLNVSIMSLILHLLLPG